jgi:Cu(I)/Ag(I) efflux system membrane fusion protein
VVSSGAYLLNSEYILRYGSGANLSGMQMSDMKMKGRSH